MRDDGQHTGRAVRRAALGARYRLAHLGTGPPMPAVSTISRRGGGRGAARRAPGRVSTEVGSVHWTTTTDSREHLRTNG